MRRELERKNQELLALQQKILQQRQLFEQERSQFYQVTNQVMSFIGNQPSSSNPSSILQPNMAVAVNAAASQLPGSQLPGSQPNLSSLENFNTPTSQICCTHSSRHCHISLRDPNHKSIYSLAKDRARIYQFINRVSNTTNHPIAMINPNFNGVVVSSA